MVNKFSLVGVAGEYQGGLDSLNWYTPILEKEGVLYAPSRYDWDEQDLKAITQHEQEYIHILPDELHCYANPGTVVWIAGAEFYNTFPNTEGLRDFWAEFQRWEILTGPYRLEFGTRESLVELSNRILQKARSLLYTSLHTTHDLISSAPQYFKVINSLPLADTRESLICRGVYYREMGDYDSQELLATNSVLLGEFNSIEKFLSAVENRVEYLAKPKIRDKKPAHSTESIYKLTSEFQKIHSLRSIKYRVVDLNAVSDVTIRPIESTFGKAERIAPPRNLPNRHIPGQGGLQI